MEAPPGTPDAITIGGEDDGQVQVQPVIQGGSRSVEIRLWRHGPSDAPPARDVLDLDLPDLDSLQQGLAEVVDASEGGTRVARIVLDTAEGRRLRVETEPFGTRFVTRIVFWQRTRVTWRPDGDPIVFAAGLVPDLRDALTQLRPWLDEPADRQMTAAIPIVPEPWPNPGADWLTVDRSSVAFHPRGVRITCTVEEQEDDHRLDIRQWRRENSLWVPERGFLSLSTNDLDALLVTLHEMAGRTEPTSTEAGEQLRVSITGNPPNIAIDRRADGDFERCIVFPLEHLPRFGRALSQSWTILVGWLSEGEREQLRGDRRVEVNPYTEEIAIPGDLPQPARSAPRPIGPAIRFGDGSDTPGQVIPQEGQVRIVLEGFLMPRGLTLPAGVVGHVITGLEELHERQKTESRIPPMLIYDRPDCAVYGRIGTNVRPEAVELRVWTSPRDSDAVMLDKVYLPEVIEALRESARLLGEQEPLPVPAASATPPGGVRPGDDDLEATATIPAIIPEPVPMHVGNLHLGSIQVQLNLTGPEDGRLLVLSWDGGVIRLPTTGLEGLLSDIRTLYYDALRGMRGRTLTLEEPPVEIALYSRGSQLQLELRGEGVLVFPADEIPAFLNAAREALTI